jgi:hypothetical protein
MLKTCRKSPRETHLTREAVIAHSSPAWGRQPVPTPVNRKRRHARVSRSQQLHIFKPHTSHTALTSASLHSVIRLSGGSRRRNSSTLSACADTSCTTTCSCGTHTTHQDSAANHPRERPEGKTHHVLTHVAHPVTPSRRILLAEVASQQGMATLRCIHAKLLQWQIHNTRVNA